MQKYIEYIKGIGLEIEGDVEACSDLASFDNLTFENGKVYMELNGLKAF